ncbi:MAG: hypothetical protein M3432_06220 [Chloroflexota bacterium]|jgi:hypothetical protein|nr:hypothetical protein [Chloroflexota bacterium]
MTDEMIPDRADEMAPEDGGDAVTDDFAQEPLAGEGTDDDEATVTEGPGQGGSTGKAGQGTADETR